MYMYNFFRFFSFIDHDKILSIVPYAMLEVLVGYFIYSSYIVILMISQRCKCLKGSCVP